MSYITDIKKKSKTGKVLEFEIETGLRDDMIIEIKDRIIHNLEATKRFLELGEDYKDICAGIYTCAVEEYGKYLFLSGLSPISPNNKIPIDYTDGNQGFLNHRHKIGLALNALPDSCKLLGRGGFTDTGFTKTGFTHNITPNFEARKSIFFVDFDKDKKYSSIVIPPEVTMDLLQKGVDDFLKFIKT
jgi:hypothetical protein